ncbi:MAG: hypothetical protein CM15mV135_010 [uncultured marine virus]|nr:MAG: hypothetical protein CM15mV135_010 [uncultured marine virus]
MAIFLKPFGEVNKQVQSEGWVFNTERDYTLTPDAVPKETCILPMP